MPKRIKSGIEYEIRLAEIAEEISICVERIQSLNAERDRIMEKMRHSYIIAALEYIEELGLPIDQVLKLLNKEIDRMEKNDNEKAT